MKESIGKAEANSSKGMPLAKAIVAVARKLMMKVYAITEKEEEYEINKAA